MISDRIMRGSENLSSVRDPVQSLKAKRKGVLGSKSNALGDVRNTLHSRLTSANLSKQTIGKKKDSFLKEQGSDLLAKKNLQKNINGWSTDVPNSPLYCNFDIHNHKLCEQSNEPLFNDFLVDHKLKEEEIDNLAKSIMPLKFAVPQSKILPLEPNDDIEICYNKIWEDDGNSSSDIFNDIALPEIQPPEEIF